MITKTAYKFPDSSIWEKLNWTWAHTLILLQFGLQVLLLFPSFGVLRVLVRSGAFSLGLFLLVSVRSPSKQKHPATLPAMIVMGIMLLQLSLNPFINSIISGIAQCGMYLAILSPIFWVTRLKITPRAFESLIFMMWGINSLSAIVGVLQVYYPGQFEYSLSTAVQNSTWGGENLIITLANGAEVYRPMGLTDVPGGAANSGLYALLFGVVIALKYKHPILRIAGISSAGIGLFCIYLTQVRSTLVLAAISMVVLAVLLLITGQLFRATTMVSSVTTLFIGTFTWAIAVGGQSTTERIMSLFAASPQEIYHKNRGTFLQDTIEKLLPEYPLGAGLGRWGMINDYFGENIYLVSRPIWVEIQWTAWLLDGGVPLICAYVLTIYWACHIAWKIATNSNLGDFALWGGLIFAYDVGVVALTFNYPIFIGQGGMEFWLINTALFVAAGNIKDNKPLNVR
ncbi:hypothetical protein NWP17_06270 [Chrysosporum bergii ANA360D]|uniref:Uncharacterized protein n=1 Tax=Chrysosporum bergii ANA360D TaxID=617107 RepID=A0AA43KB54_9CYAN|nr:hypothetical protein [Chrysosporum bergii]MDH6060044.1 hypothetical protein [Chrysosporum bergii ANA360D]